MFTEDTWSTIPTLIECESMVTLGNSYLVLRENEGNNGEDGAGGGEGSINGSCNIGVSFELVCDSCSPSKTVSDLMYNGFVSRSNSTALLRFSGT